MGNHPRVLRDRTPHGPYPRLRHGHLPYDRRRTDVREDGSNQSQIRYCRLTKSVLRPSGARRFSHVSRILFNNSNYPTATVNAIALADADGFVLFIMRDQALVAKLLDVNVAVDNENANLANVDGVAFLNEYLYILCIS